MAECLEAAIALAALGYPVLPIVPGEKIPLTDHGLKDASTDVTTIKAWWNQWPNANLAMATDGLIVVDMDVVDDQPNPWLADEPEKLADLERTGAVALTPRGGRHFVFRPPAGKSFRNTTSKLASKVDTRADGGYVLVHPSIVNGKVYQWIKPLDVPRDQLPEMPTWLIDMLDAPAASKPAPASEPTTAGQIAAGQRNATLASLAAR